MSVLYQNSSLKRFNSRIYPLARTKVPEYYLLLIT
jgi:hypothetical protein